MGSAGVTECAEGCDGGIAGMIARQETCRRLDGLARPERDTSKGAVIDLFSAVSGVAGLLMWASVVLMADVSDDRRDRDAATAQDGPADVIGGAPETQYGGYGGIPFTYPSDLRFLKHGTTDLTVHGVNWDGRPFKSPIYYGLRAIRWGEGTFGGMVDFTHSKAISQRGQVVRFSGTRNGKPAPEPQTIEKTFKHLEFSHGHNMLTLNGLARLGRITPALQPYAGIGAGVSLPHTEVQFTDEERRTYEYQYTGPAGQVLTGIEIRLSRVSLFVEYKFTLARYTAPLTGIDSRGWGYWDIPAQLLRYLRGEAPADGTVTTTLASHNLIGGVMIRQRGATAAR